MRAVSYSVSESIPRPRSDTRPQLKLEVSSIDHQLLQQSIQVFLVVLSSSDVSYLGLLLGEFKRHLRKGGLAGGRGRAAANDSDDSDDSEDDGSDSDDSDEEDSGDENQDAAASDDELAEGGEDYGLEPDFEDVDAPATAVPPGDMMDNGDLPFIYASVPSLKELLVLFGTRTAAARGTMVSRLVACHNVHLGVEKRELQQVRAWHITRGVDCTLTVWSWALRGDGGPAVPLTA